MKTFEEYIFENEQTENVDLDDQSLRKPMNESFIAGSIISLKLNSMKNRVLSEDDPKKQNDIIAQMIHFGIGTIALVTNDRRNRP